MSRNGEIFMNPDFVDSHKICVFVFVAAYVFLTLLSLRV